MYLKRTRYRISGGGRFHAREFEFIADIHPIHTWTQVLAFGEIQTIVFPAKIFSSASASALCEHLPSRAPKSRQINAY